MTEGRCKRYFPKPFSLYTVLNEHRFPTYQRRIPPEANVLDSRNNDDGNNPANNDDEEEESIAYRRRPPVPHETVEMTPEERRKYGNTVMWRIGNSMVEMDNRMVSIQSSYAPRVWRA